MVPEKRPWKSVAKESVSKINETQLCWTRLEPQCEVEKLVELYPKAEWLKEEEKNPTNKNQSK